MAGITDSQGNRLIDFHYEGYGESYYTSYDTEKAALLAQINPFGYRSYVMDLGTGFYYLQSRYYDPTLGRFINADGQIAAPGGELLGTNQFAYCFNNPVRMDDSSGNWPRWATIALGAVAAVAAVALTVVTLGAAAPAAACTITAVGMSIGASYAVASTVATAAIVTTTVVAAAYAGDMAYSAVTGDSILLNTLFQGNTEAYNVGLAAANLATAGMFQAAAYSPGICFVAGTAVLSAEGPKEIETIAVGDLVWAWDEETGEVALKHVVETYVNMSSELVHVFVNGEEIVTTPSHPFYSPIKGWTEAVHLRAGDILVLINGEYVVVEKIQHEILENPITVYNFQVEGFHTYYVSETAVLVHNACGSEKHHIISNKNRTYTPKFQEITNQFSLNLNGDWNVITLQGHSGRHTNAYHQYVFNFISQLATNAQTQDQFLSGFRILIDELISNPRLPYLK